MFLSAAYKTMRKIRLKKPILARFGVNTLKYCHNATLSFKIFAYKNCQYFITIKHCIYNAAFCANRFNSADNR